MVPFLDRSLTWRLLRPRLGCGGNWPRRGQTVEEMPKVATTCAIDLLGVFRVVVDGNAVPGDAWRHRRAADLVKLLALAPSHRLHREQVSAAVASVV